MTKYSNKYILIALISVLVLVGVYCVMNREKKETYSPSDPPPQMQSLEYIPPPEDNMEILYQGDEDLTMGSGPGLFGHYRQTGSSVGAGF